MNRKMTIFYRKSTGDLADICSDEQTMDFYGSLKADYELIFSFIIVDFDEYVMQNPRLFIIIDCAIKLKDSETLQKYM
jgi:hypothetical protein